MGLRGGAVALSVAPLLLVLNCSQPPPGNADQVCEPGETRECFVAGNYTGQMVFLRPAYGLSVTCDANGSWPEGCEPFDQSQSHPACAVVSECDPSCSRYADALEAQSFQAGFDADACVQAFGEYLACKGSCELRDDGACCHELYAVDDACIAEHGPLDYYCPTP